MLKILYATAAFAVAGCMTASASPLMRPMNVPSPIVLASGGCGFAFHRNPFGACVPNRPVVYGVPPGYVGPVRLPPPCPRGYHRDPDPARPICYPNF